jgi:hypothetical protein
MNGNGRSVWRFTPRLERDCVESSGTTDGRKDRRLTPRAWAKREETLVRGDPAEFHVGPATIRIPQGKVITAARENSNQGYWVVAPVSARPVIECVK